jgi:hypothetical protein
MTYRETSDARFLQTTRMTADYFINHLPRETSSRRVSQTVADSMHRGPALEEGRVRYCTALAALACGPVHLRRLLSAEAKVRGKLAFSLPYVGPSCGRQSEAYQRVLSQTL